MQITIVGCGAIGGLIAARLRLAGIPVTILERPDIAAILRTVGITYFDLDDNIHNLADFRVPDVAETANVADILILGLKAHQIPQALPSITPLIGDETTIVTVQNGIPWWYFHGHVSAPDSQTIHAVDPGGRLADLIPASQVVGCVAYPAAAVPEPGRVIHVEGDRMPVGAVDASQSHRAVLVSEVFSAAGFRSRVLCDLRAEIWLKAVGTASLNPLSALTRATFAQICGNEETRNLARVLMLEAAAVADALGVELRVSIDRRLEGAERVGHHRSSMLQDVERGVRMEADALLGAVVELGERLAVPTPHLVTVLAMLRLLDETTCAGS